MANPSIQPGELEPSVSNSSLAGRRKLLLVYIHGFMGDESSFRNFPAHVHALLTVLLQETHVVYSKVYPRYRSKRYISIARDDFSAWLKPHESSETDTILLGHSMGGLVSAEVVLMPPDGTTSHAFKHRILGTINFDVPFLGMHPGVISSGLASIFMPGGEAPADKYVLNETSSIEPSQSSETSSLTDPFWQPSQGDQTFNARFNNDVVLPVRKFWQSVQHFVHKHGSDLSTATSRLVSSHVEFMSAMSNAEELRTRYTKLRVLEEDNDNIRKSVAKASSFPPRVRFVNYYTASTGRPRPSKKDKDAEVQADANQSEEGEAAAAMLETSNELNGQAGTVDSQSPPEDVAPAGDPENTPEEPEESKPRKDRKFCNLPPKDSQGQRDPTWVRIYMKDVDEVGAHCGMFFVDERYERLLGDVAERIETWLNEEMSVRIATRETEPEAVTRDYDQTRERG